ncbi:MAG: non-canonical purine NTP pyrophosphatase, partial [Actinobacteria bacterium]|nr:non-canonical purine NTP pyrophosphatase [Actinomycetota bacterium]
MSVRVVLATRNAHKVIELRRILDEAGIDIELVGTDEYPDLPDVVESGSTFAANALLKAREVCAYTGLPAIADDSGLAVDALNGMPGIFSARWSGAHGNDRANL